MKSSRLRDTLASTQAFLIPISCRCCSTDPSASPKRLARLRETYEVSRRIIESFGRVLRPASACSGRRTGAVGLPPSGRQPKNRLFPSQGDFAPRTRNGTDMTIMPQVVTEESRRLPHMALIVSILSANLTRAGWWENVECAHIEEIKDRAVDGTRCSFRSDLLSIIRRIRHSASDTDDQSALEVNQEIFFVQRTQRSHVARRHSEYSYHTRIFAGQSRESLSTWLRHFSLDKHDLNLEVISPFFDSQGEGPLRELIGKRSTEARYVCFIQRIPTAHLSSHVTLTKRSGILIPPSGHGSRGRWSAEGATTSASALFRAAFTLRHIDYGSGAVRISCWSARRISQEPVIPTAVRETWRRRFSSISAEARHPRRWWLEPLDRDADRFVPNTPTNEDGCDAVGLSLSLRFDWGTKEFSYRLEDHAPDGFTVLTTAGEALATINDPVNASMDRI